MLSKSIIIITFLVGYTFFLFFTLSLYLVIKFVNENKTDEERFLEDEEQMNYLKDNMNGGS